MSNCLCKIERAENGYEVEVYDEKISARNSKGGIPWEEPYRSYLFTSAKDVVRFISENIDKFGTSDEYSVAFKKLSKEMDKD